jgi:putative SOS response-associated peptidase YedK
MCGRFIRTTPIERYSALFSAPSSVELKASYNIAPSSQILLARGNNKGGREVVALQWGLVPSWSKEPKTEYSTINARAETIDEKPTFKNAFKSRRCLIASDGFIEWQKRADGTKQPYLISLADGKPFAFAGIWERWEREGQILESCAIIVTQANELMKQIHDRMPVILSQDYYEAWMNPKESNLHRLKSLLVPYPSDRIRAYPISSLINSPKNNHRDLIEPLRQEVDRN